MRNVSCFVSDGSNQQDSSMVDDDLCGELEPSVDGDPHFVLHEICTVPCPGRKTGRQRGEKERRRGEDRVIKPNPGDHRL